MERSASLRDTASFIARARRTYPECFGCGPENPFGLHLDDFTLSGDGWLRAQFMPKPEHRGTADTLHGGLGATALDEIFVWTGIVTNDVLTVTGTLDLRYRAPVTVLSPVTVRGRVQQHRGRRLVIAGDLTQADVSCVEGHGLYVVTASTEDW